MPKKDEIAKILEARTAENPDVELHLFTDEELSQRTQNHETDVIARKTGEIYQNLENDVLSVTGIPKTQGEKAYNYLKRVLTDMKASASSSDVKALQDKLAELEKEKANGFPNLKKELDEVQKLAKDREEALQKQLTEKDKLLRAKDIDGQMSLAMMGLKFRSDMPKQVIETFINNAKKTIIDNADFDGDIVKIKGSDGSVMRNKATLQPLTISEVLIESLSPILEEKREQGGGGSDSDTIVKDKDGTLVPPADALRSKETLTDWMRKKGIAQGSKEFTDIWGKYATGLPRT